MRTHQIECVWGSRSKIPVCGNRKTFDGGFDSAGKLLPECGKKNGSLEDILRRFCIATDPKLGNDQFVYGKAFCNGNPDRTTTLAREQRCYLRFAKHVGKIWQGGGVCHQLWHLDDFHLAGR